MGCSTCGYVVYVCCVHKAACADIYSLAALHWINSVTIHFIRLVFPPAFVITLVGAGSLSPVPIPTFSILYRSTLKGWEWGLGTRLVVDRGLCCTYTGIHCGCNLVYRYGSFHGQDEQFLSRRFSTCRRTPSYTNLLPRHQYEVDMPKTETSNVSIIIIYNMLYTLPIAQSDIVPNTCMDVFPTYRMQTRNSTEQA